MVWAPRKPLLFQATGKIIHFLWDDHAQFQNLILKLWYRWNISAENILLGIPCWADGRDSVFTAVGLGLIRELGWILQAAKVPPKKKKNP